MTIKIRNLALSVTVVFFLLACSNASAQRGGRGLRGGGGRMQGGQRTRPAQQFQPRVQQGIQQRSLPGNGNFGQQRQSISPRQNLPQSRNNVAPQRNTNIGNGNFGQQRQSVSPRQNLPQNRNNRVAPQRNTNLGSNTPQTRGVYKPPSIRTGPNGGRAVVGGGGIAQGPNGRTVVKRPGIAGVGPGGTAFVRRGGGAIAGPRGVAGYRRGSAIRGPSGNVIARPASAVAIGRNGAFYATRGGAMAWHGYSARQLTRNFHSYIGVGGGFYARWGCYPFTAGWFRNYGFAPFFPVARFGAYATALTASALIAYFNPGWSSTGYEEPMEYFDSATTPLSGDIYAEAVEPVQALIDEGEEADIDANDTFESTGVIGLIPKDEEEIALVVNFAVNQDGIIRGYQVDTEDGAAAEAQGAIDRDNLRVAWEGYLDNSLQFETSVGNMMQTEGASPVNVYNPVDETVETWQMVRTDENPDE
jgi:hypothetical protein